MSEHVLCEWCSDIVELEEVMTIGWPGGEKGFELTHWCRRCADTAVMVGVTAMLRSRKRKVKQEG